MTILKRWACVLLAIAAPSPLLDAAEPLTAMTFNIRYGAAQDGDNSWPHRKELVIKTIADADPDLVGLQEAMRDQLDFLAEQLPAYAVVGVGREAKGGGEYSAIMYRRSRFDLSDSGTFWLSDDPETPGSRTWGNDLPRICTWVRLLERASGQRLVMINTHWDHMSQPARLESAGLMSEKKDALLREGEPLVVTGDFNATPENPAFKSLLEQADLRDALLELHPDEAGKATFNGFGATRRPMKIDGVLVSDRWTIEEATVIRPDEGQRFPSDHFPVTARLELAEQPESGG